MAVSQSNKSSSRIAWMWNANENPFDKSKPAEWKYYSDVENIIIEKAYAKKEPHAMFDNYHIDFKSNLQISNTDRNKQRPVKRMECNIDSTHLREDRFTFTPINPKQPFGGLYGWISPFIKEAAKDLHITKDNLPSKDKKTMSMVIDRAAAGIIEEAKLIGRKFEGEVLAEMLLKKKQAEMKEVWECCAYLYSLNCFLYKKLNEIMRLIGSKDQEHIWRNKIRTLGPFALLLWDNPSNYKPTPPGTELYRGAYLTDEAVSILEQDCLKEDKPMHSFPAFTSCSRVQTEAEKFGNVLFIMNVKHAFTVDIERFSEYPYEKEELLSPGVCFIVQSVVKKPGNKYWIYVDLIQQHRRKSNFSSWFFLTLISILESDIHEISSKNQYSNIVDLDRHDDNPYYLDDYRTAHADDWT
jgi:hypothetical protein